MRNLMHKNKAQVLFKMSIQAVCTAKRLMDIFYVILKMPISNCLSLPKYPQTHTHTTHTCAHTHASVHKINWSIESYLKTFNYVICNKVQNWHFICHMNSMIITGTKAKFLKLWSTDHLGTTKWSQGSAEMVQDCIHLP